MSGVLGLPPWKRAQLIDEAVDHVSVASAASIGPLEALYVVLARCEALGVADATVSEVVRSWSAVLGEDRPRSDEQPDDHLRDAARLPSSRVDHVYIEVSVLSGRFWHDLWLRSRGRERPR